MISWLYQLSQTILHGRDAILRVSDKWLIFNIIIQLWADVKYHVPTRFGFSPKASGFYPWGDATALAGEGGVRGVVWLIQAQLEIRHATALTTGAKHWHRQKDVFYVFVFVPPVFSTEPKLDFNGLNRCSRFI